MNDVKRKSLCPLPWMHLSAHLDSTMRICCNTDNSGFVVDNNGNNIKLSEMENIQDFFNLNFFKEVRKKMINGDQPAQCTKCYDIEKHGAHSVRQSYISQYEDNPVFIKSLENTKVDGEIEATVQSLDFSLSNKCNLKCIMCSPDASYLLKKDWDTIGIEYSSDFTEGAHKNWNNNPAFEKIIPEISNSLEDMLTTGGEPFLNNDHYRILELIVESGNAHNVNLSYHTNCTVKNEKLFKIWHKFKSISIHFSIDAHGELNEYIRKNTKWSDVEENVRIMLAHPKTICEVHTTIQVLNIFHLPKLYNWISQFEDIPQLPFHIWMDNPTWLKISILPIPLKLLALNILKNHFQNSPNNDLVFFEKKDQIISYLTRSIKEKQDKEGLEIFRKRIREFEALRGSKQIQDLVPELTKIF
jgi:organic radical activating enzyme